MTMTMRATPFPQAWNWWVDELIPHWVKRHYSPRESWKEKPFTREDAAFFGKGVQELSELFTEERPRRLPAYFQHPRYRSAYLLYFLPLQAAKFLTLFQLHPAPLDRALAAAAKKASKTLHVADLGSGPGTASLALLLAFLDRATQDPDFKIPSIEFSWWDTDSQVLSDGKGMILELAAQFPKLRGKVKVTTRTADWSEALKDSHSTWDLVFFGHVLNEGSLQSRKTAARRAMQAVNTAKLSLDEESDEADTLPAVDLPPLLSPTEEVMAESLQKIWAKVTTGGGILIVEPAFRSSAQLLSRLRDAILSEDSPESPIWGPCLHAGRCPLATGRDWCHFSVPTEIPGKWFKAFSKQLGAERSWLKYSYLWIAAQKDPAPVAQPNLRRVVSDTMPAPHSGDPSILLCEPDEVRREFLPPRLRKFRGEIFTLFPERSERDERPVRFQKKFREAKGGAPKAAPFRSREMGPTAGSGNSGGNGKEAGQPPRGGRRRSR